MQRSLPRRLLSALEWLLALAVMAVAGFMFLNGSFFSTWGSVHVDLSINLVAAHALRDGVNPYGATTLLTRAESLGSPTRFIYDQLFTSYIQPPTSALSILPLSLLPWRDATRVYLVLNHVLLFAAVGVSLVTVRPTLPRRWAVAGALVILMLYNVIYGSFSLGQVDATILLLLSIGFWGYVNSRPAVAGSAIACAAAIKLFPGLLLLYFLWKREYRTVLWGVGVGLALFLLSFAYVGYDTYHTYLTETLPALTKGSSQYSNVSLGAAIARAHTPDVVRNIPEMLYLDEVSSDPTARLASVVVGLTGLLAIAVVARGRRPSGEARRPEVLVFEYYFVVAIALLISSVSWDTYLIWLLPVFFAAFLAPGRVLPRGPARWLVFAALAIALVGFNYPGDLYLYAPNGFFYHPDWTLGVWSENQLRLYHDHLDAVLFLRLPSLLLLAATLAGLVLWRRFGLARASRPVFAAEQPSGATGQDVPA